MSTPVNASQYVNMARGLASSPDALEAGAVAKATAKEIQEEITGDGAWSLRVLSLIAGGAMMLASISGFMRKFVTFDWDSAALDIIVFVVGLGVVLVESGLLVKLESCSSTNAMINNNAPFLRNLYGRGTIFIVTGFIEVYMRGTFDMIVGFFAIYVGLMYIWTGRRAKDKMAEVRSMAWQNNKFSMEELQEKYAMADVDGKGGLTLSQFRQFTANLGMSLDKKESEAAFMYIDKNHDSRIGYDEVHRWWSKGQNKK
ncbi:expressed unknown protein [Seminavis robusta]|uniref:EF-hand domain-containing protein n=1 Tax=Seminavis robusta TaxID=568900 RepID=A0A9N8EQ37_9STRA|nr:expressed unknown protein [Seminavis robusta]|eukprot:Sro1383_g267960.1 n/a (257) ;mRNA; r:3674-4532